MSKINYNYLRGQFEVNADIVDGIKTKKLTNFNHVIKFLTYDIKRLNRRIVAIDPNQSCEARHKWRQKNQFFAGRLKSATGILGKIQHGDYHDMQHFEDKMVMMRNKKGEGVQKRKVKRINHWLRQQQKHELKNRKNLTDMKTVV